jgi:hypothetical protein
MQKPPCQRRLSRFQIKSQKKTNNNNITETLLCSLAPTNISQSSDNCSEFSSLIKQQRLSDCLKCLEDAGYVGEAALFVLANLQVFGGAA